MGSELKMASRVRLPAPKIVQSVVDWRYPKAHRYWDDSGALIRTIEAAFPGLKCAGLQPDGFKFLGRSASVTNLSFYWDKATLTQDGEAGLSPNAAKYWAIVREGLRIEGLNFLGHRTWQSYETSSEKEAIRHLESLKLWELRSDATVLGTPLVLGTVLRTQVEPDGRRLRLMLNAGTAQVSGKTAPAVIADADLVIQDLERMPFEDDALMNHIDENQKFIRQSLTPFVKQDS